MIRKSERRDAELSGPLRFVVDVRERLVILRVRTSTSESSFKNRSTWNQNVKEIRSYFDFGSIPEGSEIALVKETCVIA